MSLLSEHWRDVSQGFGWPFRKQLKHQSYLKDAEEQAPDDVPAPPLNFAQLRAAAGQEAAARRRVVAPVALAAHVPGALVRRRLPRRVSRYRGRLRLLAAALLALEDGHAAFVLGRPCDGRLIRAGPHVVLQRDEQKFKMLEGCNRREKHQRGPGRGALDAEVGD